MHPYAAYLQYNRHVVRRGDFDRRCPRCEQRLSHPSGRHVRTEDDLQEAQTTKK
jgi:hypothetical protein